MKRLLLLLLLPIAFAVSFKLFSKRGWPFMGQKQGWSIGVMVGLDPFSLQCPELYSDPILTELDVSDMEADFVADPFIILEKDSFFLFFEAFNLATNQGDICLATSKNGLEWQYVQVVLDESFHLSYPHVFKVGGEFYMIPESAENKELRLYKATNFPTEWALEEVLLTGHHLDPTPLLVGEKWWLFTCTADTNNDMLSAFWSHNLTGPYTAHVQNPIVDGNAKEARPGGRIVKWENKLYRPGQDDLPRYGSDLNLFKITTLTDSSFSEEKRPFMNCKADANKWNSDGMHHLDYVTLTDGSVLAVYDGYGQSFRWGSKY